MNGIINDYNVTIECADKYFIEKNGVLTFSVVVSSSLKTAIKLKASGCGGVCYNCEGKNYLGESFEKSVTMPENSSKRFWVSVTAAGECVIEAISEKGEKLAEKAVKIAQSDKVCSDPFANANSMNRLIWLNSDKAIDKSVPKPFDTVAVNDGEILITGRKIVLENGFPCRISSRFDKSLRMTDKYSDILSSKILFKVGNENFISKKAETEVYGDSVVECVESVSENFKLLTQTKVEFDGFIEVKNTLECLKNVCVGDIRLIVPVCEDMRKYFIGMGKKSGLFDGNLDWKWNENKNQDCFWAGNVNGGLKVKLKGENYVKPFVNVYYKQRKLNKPESWGNGGKGGVTFENGAFVAYSGERSVKQGEKLIFDIEFIVTPLKPIDFKKQFSMRFFQKMFDSDRWLERAEKAGANVINVHHGNDLNPYINYPFAEIGELKRFAAAAHSVGIAVKPYYTVRELSVNAPEFKAFMDFGHEIIAERNLSAEINPWQKDAASWVERNIGYDVICAWRQPLKGKKYKDKYDASVITEGQSRLCNFYVEGLDYLVKHADIDGIYVDDTAYDRYTMKRVRKVLNEKRGAIIDLHQWNHQLAADGDCATMYMELYPYIDKCWTGEGYDYDESPDYWLTEISGIPFGLTADMMDAGNQYKGLLFGMTSREGWETNDETPTNVWRLIDEYDLSNAVIKGWWDEESPVATNSDKLLATTYMVGDKRYVAVANFAADKVKATLTVNGKPQASFYAPFVKDFQDECVYDSVIELDGGKGLFLIVK